MLEGINFRYDGVYSVDMGLVNCKLDGGMFEETFLPSREIEEVRIKGNDKPYFRRVNLEPIEFNLTFAFEYSYDEKRIREVARWLMQDYYKPFYIVDEPSRIFYCMIEGDSKLIHNGLRQGYITLKMKCDSPYSYTPEYFRNNLIFIDTKLVKDFEENTFNSDMGSQSNIYINDGNLEIKNASVNWDMLSGKNWSEV